MITAIVRFKLPQGTTLKDATAKFQASAPSYSGVPGLARKYYLYSEDGTAGGVYLWESREAAEGFYNETWRGMIAERYGAPPTIDFFESPVIVDNEIGSVVAAE